MDSSTLIRRIRKKYLEETDLDYISDSDALLCTELYGWFLFGVRTDDIGLTACSLDILNRYVGKCSELREYLTDEVSMAVSFSSFCSVLDDIRSGESVSLLDFLDSFNPFVLTLDDIDALFQPDFAPGFIFEGTKNFVSRLSDVCTESNRQIMTYFLNRWMIQAVTYFRRHGDKLAGEEYDRGETTFLEELQSFLCDIISIPEADEAFDVFLSFVKECVRAYSLGNSWLVRPLNRAIACDNEHAFAALLGRRRNVEIYSYPSRSLKILHRLFEMGKLLPESDDGKVAFENLIRYHNPSEDIIRETYHPSYHDPEGITPLMMAVCNRDFSPENYHLFVSTMDDLASCHRDRLSALGLAILHGNRKAVEILISLGADIMETDDRGNCVLHYVCSDDNALLGDILSAVPDKPQLFFLKNNKGKTPLDYLGAEKRPFCVCSI